MTDELFLMAFCCINSDYTHLLLKATITAKSHLGKARPGRVSFSPPPPKLSWRRLISVLLPLKTRRNRGF